MIKSDFIVIETSTNYSIVENTEYKNIYYPAKLILNSKVELLIEKIDSSGKIWFNTNILNNVENTFVHTEFIRKIKKTDLKYGLIEVVFKHHVFEVKTQLWMMSDDYNFPEIIKLILKEDYNHNKKIDRISLTDVKHPHYEYNKVYEFIIEGYLKENNQVIILDEKTGLSYRALRHFSQLKVKTNIRKNYIFSGMDRYYNLFFYLSDFDFLNPKSILKDEELSLVLDNHLVDSALRLEFLSQLKNEDSFWLITITRYLVKVIANYIERNKINEAYLINRINLKLLGFCFDKDIFKSIPSKDIKLNLQNNYKQTKYLNNICEFLLNNNLNNLFDLEIISIENSSKIFIEIFKFFEFKIIEIELFISTLKKAITYINNNEVLKDLQILRDRYLKYIEENILYDFNNQYFFDKKRKEKWVLENEFHSHIKILELFNENIQSSTEFYNSNFNITVLLQLLKNISGKEKLKNSKVFLDSAFNNLPKSIKRNSIQIIDSELKINGKFKRDFNGTCSIFDNDKLALSHGHFGYLLNYYLTENNFNYKFNIYSKFLDKIFVINPEFGYSRLCDQDFNNISDGDIVDVVVKKVTKDYVAYGTYYYDLNNQKFYEGIISFEKNNSYLNKATLEIGQVLKCKAFKTKGEDASKIILIPIDNPFALEDSKFTAKGEIVKINRFKRKCPNCNTQDIISESKETKIICQNYDCGAISFIGAFVYLADIKKYIFINKYSIHGIKGSDFLEKARVGSCFNFFIEESNIINVRVKDRKEKYIDNSIEVFKVQPSEIISRNFLTPELIYVNALLRNLFVLTNDLIDFNPDIKIKEKRKLIRFSRQIGGFLKNPKTYFLALIDQYNDIIEKFKKNIDISEKIQEFKNNAESNFKKTFERYPDIKILLQIINTLQFVGDDNFSVQVDNLNSERILINKLQKLILIYNLINSEESDSEIALKFRKKIIDFLAKKTDGIFSFNLISHPTVEFSEEEKTLQLIEKGEIGEDMSTEFKETLRTPVLNNSQHKIINKLKIEGKNEEEIIKIQNSINIKDKSSQSNVTMSTFKNICAMLNSNNGQIIIGVRDDLSLIGLGEDYKLLGGYDEFQQYFDAKWNTIMCDPEKYRNYVKLKKVIYNEKEFCFINVELPNDFQDACFINYRSKDGIKSEECYIKQNSTTKPLKGRELNIFSRKIDNKTKIQDCYVYIMSDKEGNKKIGRSINPKNRGKTLMAQDPQITLLNTYKFPSIDIAHKIEKNLHIDYKSKQINGEWFDLDNDELNKVKEFLTNQEGIFGSVKTKERNLFSK